MALAEYDHAILEVKLDEYLERIRPPADIRPRLDLEYRIENQSVILFEIRPHFRTGERMDIDYAKTTYSKTDNIWKVYWKRADGKWHRYDPTPSVGSIENFMSLVDEDKHACFKG